MSFHDELMKPDGGPAFEHLMVKVCRQLYGTTFSLFGRSGQEQYGIDLYTSGFSTCVQCKNYQNANKLLNEMESDFFNAVKHFGSRLKCFILATTLNRDAPIQERAEELQQKMWSAGRTDFTFKLLFWEQICSCLREHPDFLPKYADTLSEYDRHLPNMADSLWWMGTAQEQEPLGSPSMQPFWSRTTVDAPIEWVNQDETSPDFYSNIQWLDDERPIHAGPLLISTQGRGIFFLVSKWTYGLTDSMNQYASDLFDDTTGSADTVYGWVEIRPDESTLLSADHSCTIIAVKDGRVNMEDIVRCVEKWNSLSRKGQLLFHFFGAIESVQQWNELVRSAKICIHRLRSIFGSLPISLLSAYNPLRDPSFLYSPTGPAEIPRNERAADWMRRHPEQIACILHTAYLEEYRLMQIMPALSAWPSVLEKVFMNMQKYSMDIATTYIRKYLNTLDLNFDMCAVALYHLYRSDPQWECVLMDCLKLCSDTAECTVKHLMNPEHPLPSDPDPIFYGLLTQQHPQNQTALPSPGGRLMQILNDVKDFQAVAHRENGQSLLHQIGSILLPSCGSYADETIESYHDMIRPYS